MPRFHIELAHESEHAACARALRALEQSGSHFVTHADWGCKAGVHSGWMIVEVETAELAMALVPPEYRQEAKITQLNSFTRESILAMMEDLED